MENFKENLKIFYSSGKSRGVLPGGWKVTYREANKEVARDPINLGLTATVALLLFLRLVTLESVKSAHTHTHVSNVLSSIFERANDNFQDNSREEHKKFCWKAHSCFVMLNCESTKVVKDKTTTFFPTYLVNPANHETFYPRNFCHLRYPHKSRM